jgi:hypothetical protein
VEYARDTLSNEAVNASGNDRYTRICRRGKMRDNPLAHIRIRTARDPAPIYRRSYIKLNYLLCRESVRFLANANFPRSRRCRTCGQRTFSCERTINPRTTRVSSERARSPARGDKIDMAILSCHLSLIARPPLCRPHAISTSVTARTNAVRRQIILAVSRLILLAASPVGPHVHHHGVVPVTRTYAREGRREPFRGLVLGRTRIPAE